MSRLDGPSKIPGRAYLIALDPAFVHREYLLDDQPVKIGRDANHCTITVNGATLSRTHCQIVYDGQAFLLTDLGSTNGLYVNQQRVLRHRLEEGDRIGLGTMQTDHLLFQYHSLCTRPWNFDLPAMGKAGKKGYWTIGRSVQNDIALVFESSASSLHAEIRHLRRSGLELHDCNSRNGTWVNGQSIRRVRLVDTDAVIVGATLLRFQPRADGGLHVEQHDMGASLALECVGLLRQVRPTGRWFTAPKTLLQNVTLPIQPGEFIGILGPSGAGKSTLLKMLNGYTPPTRGCVLINGMPLYRCFELFRDSLGYVPQDDIVHRELTVHDCLDYIARLRLPADWNAKERRASIDSTVEALGLTPVKNNPIHTLSGGERKRVAIGCELITRPSVLFLDEPTSGMDPSTEERLMRHFQQMAQRGTTVLITTHILYNLELLDRIIILARGQLVFFGTPREAIAFFSGNDTLLMRPIQIFDQLENLEDRDGRKDKDQTALHYAQKYRHSSLFDQHVKDNLSDFAVRLWKTSQMPIEALTTSPSNPAEPDTVATRSWVIPSWRTHSTSAHRALLDHPVMASWRLRLGSAFSWRGWITLTQRHWHLKMASPRQMVFYGLIPIVLALVTLTLNTKPLPTKDDIAQQHKELQAQLQTASSHLDLTPILKPLFTHPGVDDPRPIADILFELKYQRLVDLPIPLSVLLLMIMTAVFMGTLMACLELSTERPIYIHERMASQKISDYLLSKLPFLLALTAVQCGLFLVVCGLNPHLRWINWPMAYLALVTTAWSALTVGLFLSALDPTPGRLSVVLTIVVVLPQLILSGGLGPDFLKEQPFFMQFLSYLFPARFGFEMLMTAFYHQPDQSVLHWVSDFTEKSMGFSIGSSVYVYNNGYLALQGVGWLIASALALWRWDTAR